MFNHDFYASIVAEIKLKLICIFRYKYNINGNVTKFSNDKLFGLITIETHTDHKNWYAEILIKKDNIRVADDTGETKTFSLTQPNCFDEMLKHTIEAIKKWPTHTIRTCNKLRNPRGY